VDVGVEQQEEDAETDADADADTDAGVDADAGRSVVTIAGENKDRGAIVDCTSGVPAVTEVGGTTKDADNTAMARKWDRLRLGSEANAEAIAARSEQREPVGMLTSTFIPCPGHDAHRS
jgi:hypothetical protein